MPSPENISDLLQRFVDDRDALADDEYAQLVAALRESPELVAKLHDQLIVDDVLSQTLALDRRRFDAQVQQRIADHLRGEQELNRQADELRAMALSRLETSPGDQAWNWSSLLGLALALSIFAAVGVGIWLWQQRDAASLLARVESVAGQVIVKRVPRANDQNAEPNLQLRLGDGLQMAEDASATLVWPDGTRTTFMGPTVASLPSTKGGKRVYLEQGELLAVVAPQPSGRPMTFETPHASAIVRGTELSLKVSGEATRLDVAEGEVELVEHETSTSQLVAAAESAEAITGQEVVKHGLLWPTSREGLVYLFSPQQSLVRTGAALKSTTITPHDGATINDEEEMVFSGGYFADDGAPSLVAADLGATGAFTLEFLLTAHQPQPDAQARDTLTIFALEAGEGTLLALQQRGLQLLLLRHAPGSGEGSLVELAALPDFDRRLHVVVTYNRGSITTTIGGAPTYGRIDHVNLSKPAGKARLLFGGSTTDPADRWPGRIAGVAIYDRALSPQEIAANGR